MTSPNREGADAPDGGADPPPGSHPRAAPTAWAKSTFAVVVWGASFIATKVALREVAPATVVWLRFAIGALVVGAVVTGRGQLTRPRGRELGYFALLGLIGVTFHQWLQSTALVTSRASTTAWIVATTPIFIALLGWLALREALGWNTVVGIALASAGVLLVVTKGKLSSLAAGRFGDPGDILILISALNWAVFSVLSRGYLQAAGGRRPAARMIFYIMSIGWVFTSVQFLIVDGPGELAQLTLNGWLGIGFLGVFCSGLAYVFWYDALQVVPASQVGAFLYLEPLVTAAVAAALLEEEITPMSLLGGAVILLGVWLVNRPVRKRVTGP
jgi:drug/metabolite transporter (DMT)-like permease